MGSRPTLFEEIVQRLTTYMGYSNVSGLGFGGVWIEPNKDGVHYVWQLTCPEYIMADLFSTNNPQGRIANSGLELVALVLQEARFTFVSTNPTWRDPFTGSDNTPTVDWAFPEASTLNPVLADLLCLRSFVDYQFKITPSIFYHPGTKNSMADDACRKFHLALDIFLSLFYTTYSPQQSPGM